MCRRPACGRLAAPPDAPAFPTIVRGSRARSLRVKTPALTIALVITLPAWSAEWRVDPAAAPGGDGSAAKPFSTLAEAVAALPGAPAEPVILQLAAGVHRLGAPLVIGPAELRGQPLTIRGEPGAVVSGGRRLTGWRVEDGRWTHPWDEGPVRELFVNGERAPRSGFPADGWLRVDQALPDRRSGFTAQADLPAFEPGLELVFLHDWCVSRIPVAAIDGRLLKTTGPIGAADDQFVINNFEPHPRFRLENGLGFLAVPGTWCHDPAGRRLVYQPRAGEAPEDADTVVPAVPQLLRIAGDPANPAAAVRIEDVAFRHCRWDVPPSGFAEIQATMHIPRDQPAGPDDPAATARFVPWAVEVAWARDVVFSGCEFSRLGGSGVLLGAGTRNCALERCRVCDVSGNGIGLGEGGERRLPDGRPWTAEPAQVSTGNRVDRCEVRDCGRQVHGAIGIWAGLVTEARITDNAVHSLPYTGISVGWQWDNTPTPCGGNLVAGNHIHQVMQLLSDGGAIYTLGRQPGTALRDNLIHGVPRDTGGAESNGMFCDQGSSQFTIDHNLIHDIARSPLRFHRAGPLEVHDNAWVLPPDTPPLRFNTTDPAAIHARDNRELTAEQLAGEVRRWNERHRWQAGPPDRPAG